jgi:pyruvate/2-oxoglutarate dehydrogenase complex dihydrolipoamide dehydrogenase (E3) component
MMDHFDVMVIGAGPAGSTAALHAGSLGARVAVIDRERTGGTCTNTGCVPTRVLAITARLLRDIRGASAYGIEVSQPRIEWSRTVERVREVIENVNANKRIEARIKEMGGAFFLEGSAMFTSPNAVRLENTGRELSADKIILCVGGKARRPPIPGVKFVITPEELVTLPALPKSVVIVGSGYTGVQVTTILNAFGAQVTLLELAPTMLPGADGDVSRALRTSFERQGIEVVTGIERVDRIELNPDGTRRVTYTDSGQSRSLNCEAVILCVGWPADLENLGLEQIGLETERGFVKVNPQLQTNLPHIFVAGDANGLDMLVQGADFEARTAAENAVRGSQLIFDRSLLPSGGFTDPDHAGVGLTEIKAREQHPDCVVTTVRYDQLARAIIDNRTTGFLKIIADAQTGLILGAHGAGENAVELIQAIALAMGANSTVSSLAHVRLAYPTYSAIIGEAARKLEPMIASTGHN